MVQRARPSGGAEQARATRRASAAPSSFRSRLGRSCFLRQRAASSPCSTNRWRTRSTVATLSSAASAIRASGQAGPPSAASALSRTRAWASFLAAALLAAIISCRWQRSSSVRVTLYFFIGPLLKRLHLQEYRTGHDLQVKSGRPLASLCSRDQKRDAAGGFS